MTTVESDPAGSSFWADYYQLLGVDRRASVADIEAAYAAAVARLPTGHLSRLRRFVRGSAAADLRRARETLIDPQRRSQYDRDLDYAERFPFLPH